jgi:nucleobase:cation symporter-1, NCS1 family
MTQLSNWMLKPEASTFAPGNAWSNKDMDPVPPHLRTWTTLDFVGYWVSDALNVALWQFASSLLAIGLSW